MGINYQHNVIGDGFSLERLVYRPLDPSQTPATSTLSLDDVVTPTPTPTLVTLAPGPAFDFEAARAEFVAARARWEVGGSTDYELESLVLCECPESNRPLKITVRKGVIESIIDLESGKAITRYIYDYTHAYTYKTIRDRFDQIGHALRDPLQTYYLRAEYHPELGYPTYLEIDFQYGVPDDGFELERLIYKPLDP